MERMEQCRFIFHKKFTRPWRCAHPVSQESRFFCNTHRRKEQLYSSDTIDDTTQRNLEANNLLDNTRPTNKQKHHKKDPFEERERTKRPKKQKKPKKTKKRRWQRKTLTDNDPCVLALRLLNLSWPFTKDELRIAFKKQALFWHPDKNPDKQATERMKDINWAFKLLSEF
jgi:hypothetical protein